MGKPFFNGFFDPVLMHPELLISWTMIIILITKVFTNL